MISQANVSRGKAIKALKNNDNDIVNAIMVSHRPQNTDIRFMLLHNNMMIVSKVSLLYNLNKKYVAYLGRLICLRL